MQDMRRVLLRTIHCPLSSACLPAKARRHVTTCPSANTVKTWGLSHCNHTLWPAIPTLAAAGIKPACGLRGRLAFASMPLHRWCPPSAATDMEQCELGLSSSRRGHGAMQSNWEQLLKPAFQYLLSRFHVCVRRQSTVACRPFACSCVVDLRPRHFSAQQYQMLAHLAEVGNCDDCFGSFLI